MVEVVGRYFCEMDFSYSPEFTTYIKATDEHLIGLGIKVIWYGNIKTKAVGTHREKR